MWEDKTGRKRWRSSTRVVSTSEERRDVLMPLPPDDLSAEQFATVVRGRIRGSQLFPKWFKYLLGVMSAITVALLLAWIQCLWIGGTCGDRRTGPLGVAGGLTMLVFTTGLWRLSAAELDALVAESGTARAVLAGILPTAFGVLALSIAFIAAVSGPGADAFETVMWVVAVVFAAATISIRRRGLPRALTLPAYRRPRSS